MRTKGFHHQNLGNAACFSHLLLHNKHHDFHPKRKLHISLIHLRLTVFGQSRQLSWSRFRSLPMCLLSFQDQWLPGMCSSGCKGRKLPGDEKIYTISSVFNLRNSHCHFHPKFMDQNSFYAKLNINGMRNMPLLSKWKQFINIL